MNGAVGGVGKHSVIAARTGDQRIRWRLGWMPAFAGMTRKQPDPSINVLANFTNYDRGVINNI